MKILLIIIFVNFASYSYSQPHWIMQCPTPTPYTLNSVYFINSNTAWTVGEYNTILKTTDCGVSWEHQFSQQKGKWTSVFFISDNTGWITGDSGKILKTTNCGQNWAEQLIGTTSKLNSSFFISSDTGWVVGDDSLIFKTTNSGQNWNSNSAPHIAQYNKIVFTTRDTGWAVGNGAKIAITIDGGNQWINSALLESDDLNSICFISRDTGWIVGGFTFTGTVKKISGENWTNQYYDDGQKLFSIDFVNSNTGIAVGGFLFSEFITKTTNGGNNWSTKLLDYEIVRGLYSVDMASLTTGLTVGYNGAILKTTDTGENWFSVRTGPRSDLNSVYFVSKDTGYAAGREIMKTTNGGAVWLKQSDIFQINSIRFVSSLKGFAAGHNIILRTTDGALTWDTTLLSTSTQLNSIYFLNDNTGWAAGSPGRVYKTTNGGDNWNQLSFINSMTLYSVNFTSPDTGFVSSSGFIYKTTDGAATWSQYPFLTTARIYSLDFISENTGWAVRTDGIVLKTTNSGQFWFAQPIPAYLRSVSFANAQTGFVAAENKTYITTNGGNNWTLQTDIPGIMFTSSHFLTPEIGWVVGSAGTILKYDATIVSSNNNLFQLPQFFELKQNYPNPFNPKTIINYSIPSNVKRQTSNVKLIIYDALGRSISTLVNENKLPGSYEVEFDGSNFVSGIYFYKLIVGEYIVDTKRMVLLK